MSENTRTRRAWSALVLATIISLVFFVAAEYVFFLAILPSYRSRMPAGLVNGIFFTCHYGILLSLAAAALLASVHAVSLIRSRRR